MLKRTLAVLGLSLCFGFANLAFANHEVHDPYKAMCQSTGVFSDEKLPVTELVKNGEARLVQLFGHCGDEPNILIIDTITSPYDVVPPRYKHNIQVFESAKVKKPYWKYAYNRVYLTDETNNVIESRREEIDKTVFINVVIPDIFHLTIERFVSAKVGSPIFPHAEGNIICNRGSEEIGLLEQGYIDYVRDLKK